MRAMTGKAASCPDSEGRGADVLMWNTGPRHIPASPHAAHYLPQGTKQPRYGEHFLLPLGQVRERGSNMQPQLEDGGWSGASRWVAASTFSGQEALLKNKAALCF